jgi:hypothetical protein
VLLCRGWRYQTYFGLITVAQRSGSLSRARAPDAQSARAGRHVVPAPCNLRRLRLIDNNGADAGRAPLPPWSRVRVTLPPPLLVSPLPLSRLGRRRLGTASLRLRRLQEGGDQPPWLQRQPPVLPRNRVSTTLLSLSLPLLAMVAVDLYV